jgi:hypothetical protein
MLNISTPDQTSTAVTPPESLSFFAFKNPDPTPPPATLTAPAVAELLADIPESLALSAFQGVSFSPERRAANARNEYAAQMADDFRTLQRSATTPAKLFALHSEFARYRAGYAAKYRAYLASSARCVSWFIAGPSNFPVRRMNKRNEVAHARLTDFLAFRERALAAIAKTLNPELRPIMAGDSDALERLGVDLARARTLQEKMRDANAAIRKHHKAGPERQLAALALLGFSPVDAAKLLKPDSCRGTGFPSYRLTNNGANIRRMEKRFAAISAAKQQEDTTLEGPLARLEDCPAENRVRLFFPGKPTEEVRTALKQSGFRWTPTLGAWQAYRNRSSIPAAKGFAGITAANGAA